MFHGTLGCEKATAVAKNARVLGCGFSTGCRGRSNVLLGSFCGEIKVGKKFRTGLSGGVGLKIGFDAACDGEHLRRPANKGARSMANMVTRTLSVPPVLPICRGGKSCARVTRRCTSLKLGGRLHGPISGLLRGQGSG